MKKFKLLLAAFVATLFAFAGVKASAYTITIKNVSTGHTYEAYQIFGGDLYKGDGATTPTLSNIDWGEGVNAFTYDGESDAAKIAEKLSGQAFDSENANDFAKEASKHLATVATSQTSDGDTVVLKVSKPGYYLVKDKDGSQDSKNGAYTRFMLQVTGAESVEVKNDVPTVEKKVKETNDSTGETTDWQDAADYDINDTVPFQLTAELPKKRVDDYDHYYVEFTDTLSAGLTFKEITKVTADGTTLNENQYKKTVTKNSDATTTLSIVITDVKAVANITKDENKVVVEYNAELNSNAVLGSAGNPNSVELTYSNNPNATGDGTSKPANTGKTPKDTVKVFTYQTIINKLNENKEALKGAGFTLSKKDKDGNWNTVKALAAGEATTFEFKGLDAGNYKLEESTTPDGYNTIKPIEFTIDADYDKEAADPQLTKLSGDVTSGVAKFDANKADGSLKADIVNRKGSLLPSTGGMGTTILYVIGSILVLVAAVLLITKKRMDAAK
ncbi:LPXTG-motif cell wall anchor domain-containing protein/fimbrial isopeptide formation D2 domain-containing protein [Streptococcus equinus]|uniref:LPXTG-motif cell wall anchor domain-containing protein/fimbrial isopeptide formation D2 domain-containing protein n=1 Tax=Streptococcus equinus TaxID=1335 RepID=A0A239R5X6_STREI|nr:isopeptide-forming domain-containing fimbrial protein [Streptococcus equinus]SNU06004.1 LPXTG-motif cell wall anchor domain-containing protein/fimbrial isopeptide formation D2 domain-containing protein [Streptococcus equinus]